MVATSSTIPGSPALIEPATWRDLNALRHLEQICFPKDAWPLWDLIGVLTLPNVLRLKAVLKDQMIGFIAADIRSREHTAWIATIGVLPNQRGKGLGRALLLTCEERLADLTIRLNVRTSNQSAIQLYLTSGYQKVGVWPGYYSDGEDALVMEKQRS
ncbi:MAG TPA: GNAT family N-acetyltransferase [Anaerolineales bacterium]|nr:GNAT family N-acetyltransferase [Anaerolineales bacterium]